MEQTHNRGRRAGHLFLVSVKEVSRVQASLSMVEQLRLQSSASLGGFEEAWAISSFPQPPFSRAPYLLSCLVSIRLSVQFNMEITPERKETSNQIKTKSSHPITVAVKTFTQIEPSLTLPWGEWSPRTWQKLTCWQLSRKVYVVRSQTTGTGPTNEC